MGFGCAGVVPVCGEGGGVGGAGRLAHAGRTSGLRLSGEAWSQAVPTVGMRGKVGELLAQVRADVADSLGEESGDMGLVGSQREGGVGRLGRSAVVDLGIAGVGREWVEGEANSVASAAGCDLGVYGV